MDDSGASERTLRRLRRIAAACAILVLAIVGLSAYLRLAGAGLGCDDWPICYGRAVRESAGPEPTAEVTGAAVVARLAHRVAASAVLVMLLVMAGMCLAVRPRPRREMRDLIVLLALALSLAVLGRAAGASRVPAVAIGNLLGGFAMLALCARLAWADAATGPRWLRVAAWLSAGLLACQAALGGLVSASFALTSCAGVGDCLSKAAGFSWQALDLFGAPRLAAAPPHNPAAALGRAAHQVAGLAMLAVLLPLSLGAFLQGRRAAGIALALLVALQAALGLSMQAGGAGSLALALAHNAIAALLLAVSFFLTLPGAACGGSGLR